MFKKKAVCIDIGSKNIKIIEGKYDGEKVRVSKAITLETPENSYNDGIIKDLEEIKKILLNAFRQSNIKSKDVIFTSKSSSVITRIIEVPWVKGKEIESLIKYEIEQYLPIDFEDYVTRYKLLEEFYRDEVKYIRINVAVYPKNMAKLYWDLSKELKLNPTALDLSSNAISKVITRKNNAINFKEYDEAGARCIIDFGYDQIELSILSKGILEFTRVLNGGGSYLDANIGSQLAIGEKEAEEKKIKLTDLNGQAMLFKEGYSVDQNYFETETVNASVKLVLDRWNNEILRMLEYFRNKNKDVSLSEIYIYGGTSELKGICEYMQSFLGIPVEKISNMRSIVLEGDLEGITMGKYLNAIGAIIRIS